MSIFNNESHSRPDNLIAQMMEKREEEKCVPCVQATRKLLLAARMNVERLRQMSSDTCLTVSLSALLSLSLSLSLTHTHTSRLISLTLRIS